ncbi:hypothetical protein JG688_00002615 [Phytophthora aleatoria]|uniref:UBX domain-containing protein n=1 Tax=Phytophthora aleatoria TaxID=2496075 RepID=A0A8J5JF70_9STRA|nr:hypothetical protein JG688_00002615 [Phytophthora aleatoria]
MALNVEFNHQSKRVKVTPGTTMFQVLAEARDQFGLSDSRQYQLLHRSRPIDLSIPFRLTGISNNASVEMTELEGADEVQQVRVCVQLRDGKRVQASFGSDATMERILTFFKLLPAPEQFSLGFLRREIESHAFATTTLKELGILSGSAMFRIQAADGQPSSTPSTQNSSVTVTHSVTVSPQNHHVSFPFTMPTSSTPPATTPETLSRVLPPQTEDVEMKESVDEEQGNDVETTVMRSYEALQLLRDNNFDAVSRTAVTTLMKVVTNILSDLENDKVRSIRLSNAAFYRTVGQVKGGMEFLTSVGFAVVPETQMLVLSPSPSDKSVLEEGLRLLSIEADDLNIPPDSRPAVREKNADPNFDVFKTQITRVQASFHPNETIQDVIDHVTECLAAQYKTSRFYLYVTPPTQKLATAKTLAELNLVPAALTYLSWLEVPQAEIASTGFYIRRDLWMDEHAESKESVDTLQKAAYPKPLHLGKPMRA